MADWKRICFHMWRLPVDDAEPLWKKKSEEIIKEHIMNIPDDMLMTIPVPTEENAVWRHAVVHKVFCESRKIKENENE